MGFTRRPARDDLDGRGHTVAHPLPVKISDVHIMCAVSEQRVAPQHGQHIVVTVRHIQFRTGDIQCLSVGERILGAL